MFRSRCWRSTASRHMWVYLIPLVRRHTMQMTLIPFDPHATLLISLFPFIKRLLPQIYKFPQSSLAELARNSVIQSGFEMEVKRHWLGQHWYLPGDAGNEINKVSVFAKPSRDFFRHSAGYVLGVHCMIADPVSQCAIRRPTSRTAGSCLDTERCRRS